MTIKVAVVDYGMGNIGSICKMLRFVGAEPIVTSDATSIISSDRIILPGVGHFDRAMTNLKQMDLINPLRQAVFEKRTPLLGICLGMQLLCKSSEEGTLPGLGFFNATVRRFKFIENEHFKIPHMGWCKLCAKKESYLLDGISDFSRFYFVHSYYVDCTDSSDILAEATYEIPFVAAIERGNIHGVQFHPEKSHKYGIQLFRNFVESLS